MKPLSSTGFALFGAGLVAISYGLARFAFGLFVPPIRDELELTASVIGIIGALPLISFLLATLVAPLVTHIFGARNTAVLSGAFGVGGLVLISQAPGALLLGAGVFACGICTGLMMPALTAAMQSLVRRSLHGRVSSVMNAGTSIGVIVAVPTVLFLAGAWRLAYVSFAVLAAVGVVAAWFLLPSVSRITPANAAPPPPVSELPWSRLVRLSLFAYVMGFVSSAYWIFAPDLVVTLGGLASSATGWLWLAVGIAGLGGAVVADLADRNNPPITHALMLMMLSASLALIAASPGQTALAAFSALVFGLAYMSLTGLYLMTGIRLLPGRLSTGPVLPFMAVSLGQATGSPVVGSLVHSFGYANAFSMFSALGILFAILSPFYPGYIAQAEEEEAEEESGLQAAYDYQLQDEEGEPLQPVADIEEEAEEAEAAAAAEAEEAAEAEKAEESQKAAEAEQAEESEKAAGAEKPAEATEVSDPSDASEATEKPETTEASESTQATQTSETTEATKSMDAPEATEASESPEGSETDEATKASEYSGPRKPTRKGDG